MTLNSRENNYETATNSVKITEQLMKTKNNFNPTYLKNPDPANAFLCVIMISICTILLPFMPIAANYFSKVTENYHNNNHYK